MKKVLHACVKAPSCIIVLLLSLFAGNNVFAQPANNNCSGATLLTSNATCSNTSGTVANATNSNIPVAPCTGNPNNDVWYRFVAVSNNHVITLSNIGANLNTSGPRMQLFSGTCTSLTSVACGTTSIAVTTLEPGETYYVRVYSAGATAVNTGATFSICVTHVLIDFGKSYVNISKPDGGTVEFNDTLEIRASVVVRAGKVDSVRFTDEVPAGTTYIPNTLRVRTNEGKEFRVFTDAYTDAANDAGWITGTDITINMGYNPTDAPATKARRGRIASTHKPLFFNNACIMMATYRVRVTTAIGGRINTGGGTVTYSIATPTVETFTFPSNVVAVYTNFGVCANAVGTNTIGTEFNGTFGSGRPRNRGASTNVPDGYTYSYFVTSGPNDYYYGIANNTSTLNNYTTSNSWAKPDNSSPTHRVFNVWDIIGDHTGAADPILGNPPADTVANANGGYMLVVNAAYRIDSAFQQTISNLCPNTYYEISCWMRNICSKCGCDSNGRGATGGSGYIPTGPGDSSGVSPNVTFEINGVDYYSTGNLKYSGQWVKRGLTFFTDTFTTITLKFFNNAPGGGGNDWALDDITVATCLPNMRYSPSTTPNICNNNPLTIYDTVRSYFNNYTYYKWQRSEDGGATWTDVTAPLGPASAVWNPAVSAYEFVSGYTIPPTATFPANSGDLYRMIVATTSDNLSNDNCRSTDASSIITLNVLTCGEVLSTKFLSLTGKLTNNRSTLRWTTNAEPGPLYYDVERSANGTDFVIIGTVNGHNDPGAPQNSYAFADPQEVNGKAFYRIRMRGATGQTDYSRIVQLTAGLNTFSFGSVVNPFSQELLFDVVSAKAGVAKAELVDQFGKTILRKSLTLQEGINQLSFDNTSMLPAGMYILRIDSEQGSLYKKVMKQNQ